KYTSEQLLEDFKILKQGLETIHPGLYRYTHKNVMDSLFDQMENHLKMSLTYQEFYQKICRLVAQVKCQHTIAIPAPNELHRIIKKGKFFPLRVVWEFNTIKAYSMFDFSSEASLPPGTRIISINGQAMESIYEELIPYFSSDGEILTNKHSRLQVGTDFQVWYYLLKGRPQMFQVELEGRDGEKFTKLYQSVTFRQWTKNYKKYNAHEDPEIKEYANYYKRKEKTNRSKPIRNEFLSDDIALLTINNFDSHEFSSIVSEAFEEIERKGARNLIIDVRYNGGGSDILGRNLFSYLIQQPTAYFDSLYSSANISDTTFLFRYTDKNSEWYKQVLPMVEKMKDGRFATKPEVNEGLKWQQPSEHRFQGNVYILMNGRSASTTAEFTAAAHFNTLATFIGEESGGAYHGGHGGDFANLKLPNTKIDVQIPLTKYVMNSSEMRFKGRGTMPDYIVNETIEDFILLKDPHVELALKLIKDQ
ncbi:MAG: S41 family peptidase, partial [Bacteroidota bacterium]